jgi:hypothetical protein
LRWLAVHDRELIRMIALVVRDREWRTLPPQALRVRDTRRGMFVDAHTSIGSAILHWRLHAAPVPRGIEVRATLRAEGDVITNRAGLVVLLPTAVFANARFAVGHPDGRRTRGRLPRHIAPHQPMIDVASARLAIAEGPVLSLAFEGEIFEMEDQRNWLDPTYKLYSRPLSRPAPYCIHEGERIEQRVRVEVSGASHRIARRAHVPRQGRLPSIGIATAPGRVPDDAPTLAALREAAPAYVVHRTDARARGVSAAARLASALDADLRLETFGDGPLLAAAIRRTRPQSVSPYFSGRLLEQALAEPHTPVSSGTFADFVMLNRGAVPKHAAVVTFGLCPTVHARDDRSLVETIDALPQVFAQARRLAGRRQVDAGPCALRRRLSPRTGLPDVEPLPGQRGEYDVDPRQHAPIAAAWLACAIAVAAAEGVSRVCVFEAAGARGLVRGVAPSAQGVANVARSPAHVARSPAHAVLVALASHAAGSVTLHGLDARRGAAFVTGAAEGAELWLVDLSGTRRDLPRGAWRAGETLHVGRRRGGAQWSTMRSARLAPYGIARIAIAHRRQNVPAIARKWCVMEGDGRG